MQFIGVSIETRRTERRDIVKGRKNLSLSRKQRKALEGFFFPPGKTKLFILCTGSVWFYPKPLMLCPWNSPWTLLTTFKTQRVDGEETILGGLKPLMCQLLTTSTASKISILRPEPSFYYQEPELGLSCPQAAPSSEMRPVCGTCGWRGMDCPLMSEADAHPTAGAGSPVSTTSPPAHSGLSSPSTELVSPGGW